MPTVITQGAASAKGYGFGARATAANYIEDVFSTYLYTGNGSTQTITNGIDLSTKGGLVWIKGRADNTDHSLTDTVNGAGKFLSSNTTTAITSNSDNISAFSTTGFTASFSGFGRTNENLKTYASWTFRKQAKFFDVVTYTGNGSDPQTISHNLGSAPGCMFVKRTDSSTYGDWYVYHRALTTPSATATDNYLLLNTTAGAVQDNGYWGFGSSITTTSFQVSNKSNVNGGTYVAYLFAHDAGGFGATGTDNVISCGSFTSNGSGVATVTLGYEPQWVLIKNSAATGSWFIVDNMRPWPVGFDKIGWLIPNAADAENVGSFGLSPTSTGFSTGGSFPASSTYIYIAIRRGPMKTPTTGTSVFGLSARTGTGANATVTGGQTDDAVLIKNRGRVEGDLFAARLTGTGYLETSSTAAEVAAGITILQANPWDVMDGVKVGTTAYKTNATADTFINYLFRRAPGFFDVVCYTGTGANRTVSHNLGVVPEMMIFKRRDTTANWRVYHSSQPATDLGTLNSNIYFQTDSNVLNSTAPTASVFTVGTNAQTNASGGTYVAYLFATVAGVSKVGSYTGSGTTKQINCGFTNGSRFVLIKRVDDSGDWYVWDSARGIVAGNDPYLLLNSTAAEVTSTDYIDTYSAGFEISSTAPAAINANGGSFIFLAIA